MILIRGFGAKMMKLRLSRNVVKKRHKNVSWTRRAQVWWQSRIIFMWKILNYRKFWKAKWYPEAQIRISKTAEYSGGVEDLMNQIAGGDTMGNMAATREAGQQLPRLILRFAGDDSGKPKGIIESHAHAAT